MLKRKIGGVILSLLLSLTISERAYAVGPTKPDDICKLRKLKIGVAIDEPTIIPKKGDAKPVAPEAGYPPYLIPLYSEQLPEDKKVYVYAVGLDLDIINIIQKGFCEGSLPELAIYYAPYDELFERLRLKQVDFLVAAIAASTPSAKRRGIAYSLPYNERGGDAIAVPVETLNKDKSAAVPNFKPDVSSELTTSVVGTSETTCSKPIECALYDRLVYFEGDTLGKDKLSYVTGIDKKILKQLSVTSIPRTSLDDVLQGGIKSKGAILLDLPTLRFFMTYQPKDNDKYPYMALRDKWALLAVKPDAQGDDRYLVMKSGDVIATRIEDEELLARINSIINHARITADLAQAQAKWFGKDESMKSVDYSKNMDKDNALPLLDSSAALPEPYKKNIGFSFNIGTPVLGSEGGQKIGGSLELSDQWPISHEFTGWWQKFYHSPICLGLAQCANEMGIGIDISEEPLVKDDVSIALKRTVQIGPFWRYHFDNKNHFFEKLWLGFKVNAVYTKTVDAEKTDNTFTSDSSWKGSFVPTAGVNIPFAEKVKLEVSVELDDILITRGKPEPSLQTKMGIKVEIN